MIPDPFVFPHVGTAALVEGFWLIRRDRQDRVPLPVRTWFGAPEDPETGEPLDRSWRWRVHIAGQDCDGDEVRVGTITITSLCDFWPACCRHPIDADEYAYRMQRAAWAGQYDPNDPFGDTSARIDPMTTTLPFMDVL